MIDLTKNEETIQQNAKHCKSHNIKLPTFRQMQNPETIDDEIKDELKNVSLWESHPANLFRINWKNEPIAKGGGFRWNNQIIYPPETTAFGNRFIFPVDPK